MAILNDLEDLLKIHGTSCNNVYPDYRQDFPRIDDKNYFVSRSHDAHRHVVCIAEVDPLSHTARKSTFWNGDITGYQCAYQGTEQPLDMKALVNVEPEMEKTDEARKFFEDTTALLVGYYRAK